MTPNEQPAMLLMIANKAIVAPVRQRTDIHFGSTEQVMVERRLDCHGKDSSFGSE
jgi:hypothetical protein